ncbi:MAG: hypothetical protein IJR04_06085 [Bacteroidales bacterium]|nr:hypothetical protein [Bacteroidales bacterium]
MFEKEIGIIKRTSQTGLWGSVGAVILTAAFMMSPWTLRQSAYVSRWMLIAGSVLAVLAVSMTLMVVRRQVPRLRQSESLEAKLQGYALHVTSTFMSMFAVVVLLCLMTVLSGQNVLLMLSMVATLTLFLAYPNIYKVKVDLGLTDEEMKSLYGDRYISDNKNEE